MIKFYMAQFLDAPGVLVALKFNDPQYDYTMQQFYIEIRVCDLTKFKQELDI